MRYHRIVEKKVVTASLLETGSDLSSPKLQSRFYADVICEMNRIRQQNYDEGQHGGQAPSP